jgi:hypothetical protein
MAYDLPMLQSRITVPAGGWPVTVQDSGGTEVYTVAQTQTYLSDFLAALAAGLTGFGSLDGTYSAARDNNGRITLSATGGGNISFTWGSAALRDLLGFAGNLSGAASHISPGAAKAIYLPDRPIANPMVPDGHTGKLISNRTFVVAPSGNSEVLDYGGRRVNAWEWRGLSGRKTWSTLETYANESFESFWEYALLREPFRYHWDRDDAASYTSWRLAGPDDMPATPDIEGFVGGPGAEGAALHWNIGRLDFVRYA